MRKTYLDSLPLEEALLRFCNELSRRNIDRPCPAVLVATEASLGRVTASSVFAGRCSPHYNSAAMDGVALRADDTFGASEVNPKRLYAGTSAFYVDTGQPLPEGCDAVIMVEDIQEVSPGAIEIIAGAVPWQHVRIVGEDLVAGELLLPEAHQIRPVDIGALLSVGVTQVEVRRPPEVGILPTGSELVPPEVEPGPGEIVESNSHVLAGMVREYGGVSVRYEIVRDDLEEIKRQLVHAAARSDVVVINAGSSAGRRDYTAKAISDLGDLIIHGVAIRPGKPVVCGIVSGKPVIGIPGYPVSSVLTFDLFVRPLIFKKLGLRPPRRPQMKAILTRRVVSPMGTDEFVRVKLGRVGDKVVAVPQARGAGAIASLLQADGVVRLDRGSQGADAGRQVTVELLRPLSALDERILVTGSHDLTLDLLAIHLRRQCGFSLSSAHLGSMGGLTAVGRDEAHMAGCHLLDEETGEYNLPFVERLLPDADVVVVNMTYRLQGLLVPKGNPKGILGISDLARDDVQFVNRQRGAGTRVLLDIRLRQQGISPSRIRGYSREEFTHTAVAAAVASGAGDTGLGVLAAAKAFDLGFVEIATERYDLVMRRRTFESYIGEMVTHLLRSKEFQGEVLALGGYDVSRMGEVLHFAGARGDSG